MPREPKTKTNPASQRRPWRAPLVILAEDARDADRITNEFPTDAHTAASIITGQS